jgi:RNA polymerase sigma factor (sigma-70 family)
MSKSVEHVLDELLVLNSQAGDKKSLEALVNRWNSKLVKHATYMIHDSNAAQDVVQDSWIAICRTVPKLNDPAKFRFWAYKIVSHKCIDMIRKQQTNRSAIKKAHAEPKYVSNEKELDEDNLNEEVTALRKAMSLMSKETEILLKLFYTEQLSTKEISKTLKIPVGTVKSRLFKARNELKISIERRSK